MGKNHMLTIPVAKSTNAVLARGAKSVGMSKRAFASLLIETAADAHAKGKLRVTTPEADFSTTPAR